MVLPMMLPAQYIVVQGCSKTLTDPQRASLARLYVALAKRDEEGVYRAAVEMGIRTRNMNKRVIINFVTHFFDRDMT
jgi:predicted unusual protein kinase regulating ubiquinone biosynthesis (AarF/ABC1/UbiB family)